MISQQDVAVGGDGFHYLGSARLAGQGQWFEFPFSPGGPDAHHPPVWTVMLSSVAVAGANAPLPYQLFAAMIGASTIALVGAAGRKIVDERVGLIVAALAAVYPGLWRYERELLSEVVLMPLVALVLLFAYRYRDRPSLANAILLSAVCSVLALARAEQLALFVLLVLPLVLATRVVSWTRRFMWLTACAGTGLVLMAPWAAFNAARFKEPSLLSTGTGSTMLAGACDATYSGDLMGHFDTLHCIQPHYGPLASLDRSEFDLETRELALNYTLDHLDRLPAVILAREGRTFGVYRPFQEVRLGSRWSGTAAWVGYVWTLAYWVLLPFAVAGGVILRRRRVPLYPLLVEFAIVLISAAITFGLIRYRAAAEVPFLILSAVAIDSLARIRASGFAAEMTRLDRTEK